jgi:sugar diacid utilization regulator
VSGSVEAGTDAPSFTGSLLAVAHRAAELALLPTADDVIRAVVQATQEMFASDVAYFTMHDEETDEFYVRETVGFLSEAFLHDRSTIRGFGIYGYIIDHLRPFWSSDYDNDTRFRHHPINVSSIRAEGIRALAGAPAVLAGRSMPAVVFVGFRSVREFTDEEIKLLLVWSKVAGAAVENALRRVEHAERHTALAADAERLSAETDALRDMDDVQQRLAELVTNGATLDELVAELSVVLDAPVVVRDDTGRVQGAVDEDRAALAVPEESVRRSFEERRAVGEGHVAVCAVRGQTQLVGSVAVTLDREATARDLQVLERAAIHVAALMLSRERLVAAANRAMADIVVGLLRQPQDDLESLAVQAARQGVRLRDDVGLVVLDVDGLGASRALERARAELRSRPALVSFYNGTLVVLSNGRPDDELAARMTAALSSGRGAATAVVASRAMAATRLPGAFGVAQRCLRLAIALGRRGHVVPEAELAPYATVFGRLSSEELEEYLDGLIGPLLAHDRERGTDLVMTLHTFLRTGASVRATADQLFVHPNTVRQRLATAETVLPLFADPAAHLDIHLALRLHALRQPPG